MDDKVTFGESVRQRRQALDLTQAALARRAGCAVITIQKIEAGDRRPSRQVAESLAAALDVPLDERAAFVRRARGEAPSRQPASAAVPPSGEPPHNLPAEPNAFVGRQAVLAELSRLLERARLLTLTGPGGIGKTRLALQLARQVLPAFADGVFFVPLAALRAPDQVAEAVAGMLEVRTPNKAGPLLALQRHLRSKTLLLVLDNFEHLLSAVPLAAALLSEAPGLKILATSREPLGVYGEQEYLVPPLALPAAHRPELWPALAQVEAVALFVQRAHAVLPGFALDAATAGAVADICLRLDGLPLALELAAARVKLFSPPALLLRLEGRGLAVLGRGPRDAPQRHQTLRATIDWSYQLLNEPERALFAALAVFAGDFGLEAAEVLCGATDGEALASLVNKSLVQREGAGPDGYRFHLLETVREFAEELLEAGPQAQPVRQQHLAYFADLADTAAAHILGAAQAEWLKRLAGEHPNLNAALAWSLAAPLSRGLDTGMRLAGALGWYWHLRGHWREGRQWLARLLAQPGGAADARARALCAAGLLAWAQDDYAEAEDQLRAGLALLPAGRPTLNHAHATGILGVVLLYQQDLAGAEPLFEASLEMFRALADPFGEGVSLMRLGLVARLKKDFERATEASTASLTLYQALDNPWGIATANANLGEIALDQADWQTAAGHYRAALAALQPTGSQWYLALSLVGVAGVAAARGEPGRAARLLGVVEALVKDVDGRIPVVDRWLYDRFLAQARALLNRDEFEAALAEGRAASPVAWQAWVEAALGP
ncbi:MAG: helix-turn-helix domain-containing protein [Anaerolineales bacterium]|nr:helix-turn-helix domain-containing protein [Anaerolineales bacterium]